MASAVVAGAQRVAGRVRSEALFVSLSGAHAALLVAAPSVPLIALGLWWNANTIAHNFIHRPFFRRRALNRTYSVFLSLVLGVPQSLWRARHLRHHAAIGSAVPVRLPLFGLQTGVESALIATMWGAILAIAPAFFLTVYLPGWLIGLGLCQLQGHYEHAPATTSHYGRIYNWLFFNDGYHAEHHLRPAAHWADLDRVVAPGARRSRWPPVLRWLDAYSLEGLERLVVRRPFLQRFVVAVHERAMRRLLAGAGPIDRVLIVGGGLFPRTALVLRRVLPDAKLTIVDSCEEHLAIARRFVADDVTLRLGDWTPEDRSGADLVVVPLAFVGDRRRVIASPPARLVLVHDWIWSSTPGTVISWLLLKKLILVARADPH
jgi:hypothetical protein